MALKTLVIVLLVALSACQTNETDEVNSLPGYIDFKGQKLFKMYSGMLPVKTEPLMNMHYVFVTSMSNTSETDPVVVWLNGGPGCSSLLGFTQQLGPCLMLPGAKTFSNQVNPYAWNQIANVLYLENPPGVGYSQNEDKTFEYNENNTAANAYIAISAWLDRFPFYRKNQFWITGESYCGMYIPYLAYEIVNRNKVAPIDKVINFKGIMIGNGVMITELNWRRQAKTKFYRLHQFYGPEIQGLLSSCTYTNKDQLIPSCLQGQKMAAKAVEAVNVYATIGMCYNNVKTDGSVGKRRRKYFYTPWDEEDNPYVGADVIPCTDDSNMNLYFNDLKVKQALHVDGVNQTWESCNQHIGDTYKKSNDSTWTFDTLKANGIKIMLYSGNTDAQVSHVETETYIKKIGWKQLTDTEPMKNTYGSMIGWRTKYDGLTYYVVNGAGHMVPTDRPYAAFRIFSEFLKS